MEYEMKELEKKAKTAFEVWQYTVEEALKSLPKAFNTGELSDEISKIRKRKDWIKLEDAEEEITRLKVLELMRKKKESQGGEAK